MHPCSEDLVLDHVEAFLRSATLQAVVRLDGSAAIREFSSYALAQNFGDTLRRHPEHYHAKAAQGASHDSGGDGIASAHDRVAFKHDIGPADMVADPVPRDLLRDAWIDATGTEHALAGYIETAALSGLAFACEEAGLRVEKTVAVAADALLARWRIRDDAVRSFRTTLDFAMPSCDGYSGRYIVGDSIPCGFGQALDVAGVPVVVLDDRFLRGGVALECSPPARMRGRPYFTVSQSEDGFERVMQSATIVVDWDVAGEATLELAVRVRPG